MLFSTKIEINRTSVIFSFVNRDDRTKFDAWVEFHFNVIIRYSDVDSSEISTFESATEYMTKTFQNLMIV